MGQKLGPVPLWEGGAGSPTNTMWPGPRPTCVPSFIFIRPTVWPQYTKVTHRTDRQRTDSIGQPFYKRLPNHIIIDFIKETHFISNRNTYFNFGFTAHFYHCSLWPPCIADADIIFSSCGFFFLLTSCSCLLSPSSPFSHAHARTRHQPDSSPPGLAQWTCHKRPGSLLQ